MHPHKFTPSLPLSSPPLLTNLLSNANTTLKGVSVS